MTCIFCEIISGEIFSHKAYEDSHVMAFLDIRPINPGHVLVVPRKHYADLFDMSHDEYGHLMDVVKKIAERVKKSFKPPRVGLMVVGFDVDHAHVHVVPLQNAGDITSKKLLDGSAVLRDSQLLAEDAEKLQNNLQ